MGSDIPSYKKTLIADLADAISSFNIAAVRSLLSEDGKFAVQNENYEITISGKEEFIRWLNGCYRKTGSAVKFKKRLGFTIIQSMHRMTGNPIIVFEEGRFPLFSADQGENEQSGLVIISDETTITGIELCFLILKTESPFIYEKKYLRPEI
jgi:hypothetical protein